MEQSGRKRRQPVATMGWRRNASNRRKPLPWVVYRAPKFRRRTAPRRPRPTLPSSGTTACSSPATPMKRRLEAPDVRRQLRRTETGGRPRLDGTIATVTSRLVAAQHLRDLALLRWVRDRIDQDYAQPLDVD